MPHCHVAVLLLQPGLAPLVRFQQRRCQRKLAQGSTAQPSKSQKSCRQAESQWQTNATHLQEECGAQVQGQGQAKQYISKSNRWWAVSRGAAGHIPSTALQLPACPPQPPPALTL